MHSFNHFSSLRASSIDFGSIWETKAVCMQKFEIELRVETPSFICPMMFSTDRSLGILHSLGNSLCCRISIGCFEQSTSCFSAQRSSFSKLMFCSSSSTLFFYIWMLLRSTSSKTTWTDSSTVISVRIDGFKLEGGELFKGDFRKLLKQEWIYLRKQLIQKFSSPKQ